MDENLPDERIVNALENARPAAAPESMVRNLEIQAAHFANRRKSRFSRNAIFGIAAGLLLLIAVNALLIQYRMKMPTHTSAQATEDYELIPVKSIYHE